MLHGIPVYFVQDIETSYYPDDEMTRHSVIDSYRPEFNYMTISSWNRDRLREFGLDAALIPPGIDLETFRLLEDVERREDMVLALGRSNPLKNLPLTVDAWRALGGTAALEGTPELCLFGIEPELATDPGMRHVQAPSDEEVNELFNTATVFVQTSTHEGFCLPPLEAMATGGAVVCTDAHGKLRDFCVDGENCLDGRAGPRLGQGGARTRARTDHQPSGVPARAPWARAGEGTASGVCLWRRRIETARWRSSCRRSARPARVDLDGGTGPRAAG